VHALDRLGERDRRHRPYEHLQAPRHAFLERLVGHEDLEHRHHRRLPELARQPFGLLEARLRRRTRGRRGLHDLVERVADEADEQVALRDGVDRIVGHREARRAEAAGQRLGDRREHPLRLLAPVRRELQHTGLRCWREVAARDELLDELARRGERAHRRRQLRGVLAREPRDRVGEPQADRRDRPQRRRDAPLPAVLFLAVATSFTRTGDRPQRRLFGGQQHLDEDRLGARAQVGRQVVGYARNPTVGPQGDPGIGGLASVQVGSVQVSA
jgi:hypothetical protein